MKSSTGSCGSSRSVINAAASLGTLDGSVKSLSGSGLITGSIHSQGSQHSNTTQKANPEVPVDEEPTFLEKAKFYTSLCLGEWGNNLIFLKGYNHYNLIFLSGTTAILSVFAFLFLIPFVVDPAISTIVADFDQVPVTCIVVEHNYAEGLRNCNWSSCREGCTTAALK